MSSVYCMECHEQRGHNQVFDIEIMNDRVYWCFVCAGKQLEIADLKIVPMTSKEKTHKMVRFKTSRGYVSFRVRKSSDRNQSNKK